MAAASWNEVTPVTIQNCYRHAGFVQKNSGELTEREELPVPSAADESLSEVSNLFEKLARMTDFFPKISVEDYINVDETTETCAEMSLAHIASSLQQREPEEESANEEDVTIPPVTSKMALQALDTIQTFLMRQQETEKSIRALQLSIALGNCVEKAALQAKKQSTIGSYFSKKN
ncbi:tigger transposable element-derived protein 4-like [Plakobranchus ocellatus]|uniref:Tigger transposable element-derived protein 4-like n=1 Tax=Plakobranchus ocellatus TaxID=259542 RepID=A0AAV3ZRJ1_9GAST|nr:tigger transposable element-derived protein 4-like [Plakobranchus ocellatus]